MIPQTVIAMVVAVALFAAGWWVEGNRKDAEIARLMATYRESESRATKQAMERLLAAQAMADALQTRVAAAETARDQLTQEKAHAIRRLTVGRPCLDRAAVRLLNDASRAGDADLSAPARQPLPADAAFATDTDVGLWAAEARRAYDTCRGRLAGLAEFYGDTE